MSFLKSGFKTDFKHLKQKVPLNLKAMGKEFTMVTKLNNKISEFKQQIEDT